MNRPKPDWAGKTKQPQGSAGPKPRPNGQIVATMPSPLVEWRCPHCQNLLLKARLASGSWVQTVCPKCRQMVERGTLG